MPLGATKLYLFGISDDPHQALTRLTDTAAALLDLHRTATFTGLVLDRPDAQRR